MTKLFWYTAFSFTISHKMIKKRKGREKAMGNIGMTILMVVGGAVGIFSSLYIAVSFPALIIWKIYRKIRYGYKLVD